MEVPCRFTPDRWEFWKEQLQWISEQSVLNTRTRDEARMLEEQMQNIQQHSEQSAAA